MRNYDVIIVVDSRLAESQFRFRNCEMTLQRITKFFTDTILKEKREDDIELTLFKIDINGPTESSIFDSLPREMIILIGRIAVQEVARYQKHIIEADILYNFVSLS